MHNGANGEKFFKDAWMEFRDSLKANRTLLIAAERNRVKMAQ